MVTHALNPSEGRPGLSANQVCISNEEPVLWTPWEYVSSSLCQFMWRGDGGATEGHQFIVEGAQNKGSWKDKTGDGAEVDLTL